MHIDLTGGLLKVNKVSLRTYHTHAKTQLLQPSTKSFDKGSSSTDTTSGGAISESQDKEKKAVALAESQVEKFLKEFQEYGPL